MDRVDRAKAFLKKIADAGAIEDVRARPEETVADAGTDALLAAASLRKAGAASAPAGALEMLKVAAPSPQHEEEVHETTRRAAEKVLTGDELTPPEQFALEAIIIPGKRPAVDIVENGNFTVTMPEFSDFSSNPALKRNIQTALRSIGRIEVSGFPGLPYGGTGFVVGKDLLVTNRHVAELFSNGLGMAGLRFKPGMGSGIDFRQEIDHRQPETISVRDIVMIHPYWDMALLRVEGLDGHAPLNLSVEQPEGFDGRPVAVVGYPAFDPRNPADVQNSVFNGVYNVKRLLPGKAGGRRSINSFGHNVSAATHDASTLGGNSGSAVVDPSTGAVLGLHFAGLYLDANFFVPACELSRDDRVVKAGANFQSIASPDPVQTSAWWRGTEGPAMNSTNAVSPASGVALGGGALSIVVPLHITVDVGAAFKRG